MEPKEGVFVPNDCIKEDKFKGGKVKEIIEEMKHQAEPVLSKNKGTVPYTGYPA